MNGKLMSPQKLLDCLVWQATEHRSTSLLLATASWLFPEEKCGPLFAEILQAWATTPES